MPRQLYLETRLYNVNDRLASLNLCDEIDKWSAQGLLADMGPCFLPYRDNLEVEEPEDWGRAIFDLDMDALRASCGVVGYFDGPHYDSGCTFEVGCGWAMGYPVDLITTDFNKWTVGDDYEHYYFGSKLLEYIADLVAIPEQDESIADYRARTMDQIERCYAELRQKLARDFGQARQPVPVKALSTRYDYYLDPNFKYTESGRWLLEAIQKAAQKAGKSWVVGDNQGDIAADLDNLRSSAHAIFFGDPHDPHVDSSLLHGIAYGIGCKPILYASNSQRYGEGSVADSAGHNLMIHYSAHRVVATLAELEAFIAG